MATEREQRLYGHIRSALDGYERDEIALPSLVASVDAAVSTLIAEAPGAAWLQELRTAWSGLEIVYADLLDEDRATLDEADRADMAESIAEIRSLLATHGDGG
jgi:hypothetical protein